MVELEVGKMYKYKALCEAFGLEPKTGNAKKAHFKIFEQYLSYEKQGTWFLINEIYDVPKDKKDNRGKSETSIQALKDNQGHKKPDFNYNDELQLMILLCLVKRTHTENDELGRRSNVKYDYTIGTTALFVQTGLCSEYYYEVLSKDGFYLIGTIDQIKQGKALYTRCEFKEAFRDFYRHMQNDTRTALNDLRRRKVLDYIETKSWFDGTKWHACTDYEMQCIVEAREDTIDWWNATHTKQLDETYDLYNGWTLTQKEKDEAFAWMNNRLTETLNENYVCHTSSFKVYCSQRAIERHLTNIGYSELLHNKDEADEKLQQVSKKNLELQLKRTLDKRRMEDLEKMEQYIKLQEEKTGHTGRRGFGKCAVINRAPYAPLANDTIYENAKELLRQGILGADETQITKAKKVIKDRKMQ